MWTLRLYLCIALLFSSITGAVVYLRRARRLSCHRQDEERPESTETDLLISDEEILPDYLPEYRELSDDIEARLPQTFLTRSPLIKPATSICVKVYSGKCYRLPAKANDTLQSLRSQIQAKAKIPKAHRFLYAGRVVEDDSTLEECRIYDRATLCLIPIRKNAGVQIFVRNLKGNTMAFFIWPKHNTVNDLKLGFMLRSGIDLTHENFNLLRVVYQQKQLDYRYTLKYYGVKAESTMHLILGLVGGFDGLDQPPPSYGTFDSTFGLSSLSRPSTQSSFNISDLGLDETGAPSPQYGSPANMWIASPQENALAHYHRFEATLLVNIQQQEDLSNITEELPAYQLEEPQTETMPSIETQNDELISVSRKSSLIFQDVQMDESLYLHSDSATLDLGEKDEKAAFLPSSSGNPSPESSSEDSSQLSSTGIRCIVPSCMRDFPTRSALNHHMRYHTKSHQCPFCALSFGTVTHQKRHINDVHQTVQRYHCTIAKCRYANGSSHPKFFSRKDNWRRHMLKHQSEDTA
ncbi:hypothetical protein BJ878DRAFT_89282 [Calycina marina]|uniref:Ubiquitin-like domain-containing protein n=1 Tax=Calycina marina TaxID=1763456 RepID=A0A9P7ZBN8_9HELO|nr:hypothetical protein BJ878DRAFT_89282 [Calycina marina]